MQRRLVSETAEPQKARLRWVREARPRARTSVAVSERAQQKDYIHHTSAINNQQSAFSPIFTAIR